MYVIIQRKYYYGVAVNDIFVTFAFTERFRVLKTFLTLLLIVDVGVYVDLNSHANSYLVRQFYLFYTRQL